ncbi:hypothetical protein MN608_07054 [Microdochium nivale]|nr:hypothetical protein MN608_07054 [Microdochium nivale]
MAEWKQREATMDADQTEALPPYSVEDDSQNIVVPGSATESTSARQEGGGDISSPAPPPFSPSPASNSTGPSGSIIDSKARLAAAERARTDQPAEPIIDSKTRLAATERTGTDPPAESIVESKARLAAAEREPTGPAAAGPTTAEPFNFPSDATLPPYSPADAGVGFDASSTSARAQYLPVLIPQVRPKSDSPFLTAYSQDLLRYGIPKETWLSFVDTLSAFLTANISEKALSHAADIGRQIGDVPTDFGRSVADTAMHVGRGIKQSAMKGNIFDMAASMVGGAIGLTVGLPLKLAASATSLPAKAAMAVMTPPQAPRARASAYALVANGEWFGQRGLKAQIMDSQQVSELLAISMEDLLLDTKAARKVAEKKAAAKQQTVSIIDSKRATPAPIAKQPLAHLQGSIADLEEPSEEDATLSRTMSTKSSKAKASTAKPASKHLEELGKGTLWLVVTQEKNKSVQAADENTPSSPRSSGDRGA